MTGTKMALTPDISLFTTRFQAEMKEHNVKKTGCMPKIVPMLVVLPHLRTVNLAMVHSSQLEVTPCTFSRLNASVREKPTCPVCAAKRLSNYFSL